MKRRLMLLLAALAMALPLGAGIAMAGPGENSKGPEGKPCTADHEHSRAGDHVDPEKCERHGGETGEDGGETGENGGETGENGGETGEDGETAEACTDPEAALILPVDASPIAYACVALLPSDQANVVGTCPEGGLTVDVPADPLLQACATLGPGFEGGP